MVRYIILLFLILTQYSRISIAVEAEKEIIMILPIQHQALDDIVLGFKEKIVRAYNKPVKITVYNAHGDYNVQNAMIQQAKQRKNIDLVVPVTTTVLQSAASVIHDRPVLGIAAMYTEKERLSRAHKNLTVVQDEIDPKHFLTLIKWVFPDIKKIAVVYSNDAKIHDDVILFQKLCKDENIKLQKLRVSELIDLYSVSRAIDHDAGVIFIFKDNLIASGIETLNQQALKHNIPVVTSDEGTVKKGADFSLGVTEKDIGVEGAVIASKILNGAEVAQMPVYSIENLNVFYNVNSKVNYQIIEKVSKELGYRLVRVRGEK